MRRGLLLALLVAAALPAPAAAESVSVSMPGKYFEPARLTTVAGDAITFRNADLVTHNVRIAGGLFESGSLGRLGSWTQAIDAPGEYPFLCTLHAFMSGNLSVVAATLSASPDGVLAGQPLTLSGRTRAGTVGPSRTVTPEVTASIDLHVALRRARLSVHAMPAPPGMVATLQLYDRWHYRWRARRTAKLDAHGGATFRLPRRARTYARVVLRRGKGPALVSSRVLRTSDGRTAPDPDTIAPPQYGGGHHGH